MHSKVNSGDFVRRLAKKVSRGERGKNMCRHSGQTHLLNSGNRPDSPVNTHSTRSALRESSTAKNSSSTLKYGATSVAAAAARPRCTICTTDLE